MPSPVLARLVTFVDYKKDLEPNDVVLIKVGPYYLQYNRAKGMNVDTGLFADQVSITHAKDAQSDSTSIGGLGAGQLVSLPKFRNTGYDLVIEVCQFGTTGDDTSTAGLAKQFIFGYTDDTVIDYAWVSIYLDNGRQQSQCGRIGQQETYQPSSEPTSSPPTSKPTLSPSRQPTPRPTLHPTSSPVSDTRTPEDGLAVHLAVPERVQKKEPEITMKDSAKLSLSLRRDSPGERRRLKGRR